MTARRADPNEVLKREQTRQAANQVTVGNCVLSLRLLSVVDWNAFFEQASQVEAILREDPSGIYPRQDFATSDRYRRSVEMIARGSKADEIEVARRVVDMAGRDRGSSEPLGHVGFYLIDRGQRELKAAFGYRPGWREPVEFMSHCSTKWATFLLSLKALLETGTGAPHPRDLQISNWH